MDSRRGARTTIDPKVRQVGFFTPQVPLDRAHSVPPETTSPPLSEMSPASNSLSPVMIPPPRHASDPLTIRRPLPSDAVPVGSYNPSESLLVLSPVHSPSSTRLSGDGEFSEDSPYRCRRSNSGKFASSFPSGGFDLTTAKAGNFAGRNMKAGTAKKPQKERGRKKL